MAEEPTTETKEPKSSLPPVYWEIEKQLLNLISKENQDAAMNILGDLVQIGKDGYQFAVDLISELCTELTGVKSLQIVPKGPLEMDVDIKRKKDLVLKMKHPIAPFVELRAITFGADMNFGSVVDRDNKGLRMNMRRGLKMAFGLGPVETTVDIKGSCLLTRNDKKQLILSTTTMIPGLDSPITISVPLTQLFAQRKSLM